MYYLIQKPFLGMEIKLFQWLFTLPFYSFLDPSNNKNRVRNNAALAYINCCPCCSVLATIFSIPVPGFVIGCTIA